MNVDAKSDHLPAAGAGQFSVDHEIYRDVSCKARLTEIKLIGSTFAVKPEVLNLAADIDDFDLRYSGERKYYSFQEDKGHAFGQFEWLAEIKIGRKTSLRLKASYLLMYSELVNCDADHVDFFFEKVGRFATYPYFRSHFSHHTTETGVMIPPLPTLRERVD